MRPSHERRTDEETPLLQTKSKTPLPWGQIYLALLTLAAEPLSSEYIVPFINQLIGELGITGGDDRKIGYYAGLIESLFYTTQALTTWRWCRLSDFVGRRPVILFGLLGLSASNFAFGLSRTLITLIIGRCIAGVLNGNVGVMKSVIGDITDKANMARVFPMMPVVYYLGASIAPLYGGTLARPQDRWPNIFRGKFWATYPYFLPSLVSGSSTLLMFLVCSIFLKESLPSKVSAKPRSEQPTIENCPDNLPAQGAQPTPTLTLLKTYSVMIPIANYGMLALVEIAFLALLPLFCSSPIEIGGLGFPPSVIGTYMAVFGILTAVLQVFVAARIIEWIGPKRLFCWAVLWYYPLFLMFPIMSAVVNAQRKVGSLAWALLILQLVFMVSVELSFSVISIFVTRASPNRRSLGTTNGLSQSLASIARAIGPAAATSLFAVSKEYNVLGGNLIYVVLVILATILVLLSRRLPEL